MNRYCLICGKERSDDLEEGGRAARARVCRKCRQIPRSYRLKVLALDEVAGLWEQAAISDKEIQRLEELSGFEDVEVRRIASLMLRVARLTPERKRRAARIREQDPALYRALLEEGYLEQPPERDSSTDE